MQREPPCAKNRKWSAKDKELKIPRSDGTKKEKKKQDQHAIKRRAVCTPA
jgi:hypothetical protein